MANKNLTIFQKLGQVISPDGIKPKQQQPSTQRYNIGSGELLKTDNKAEYETAKLQAQQNKYLGSVWKKVENGLFQQSINYETTRIGSYADFEAMEFYPTIAAALDVMMEECLGGETIIPLLNGTEHTIESLYENNITNFWVYAVDINGDKIKPSMVDKVILKGVKDTYKITLDDGSEIVCTDNHKWLSYDNKWVETKDLIYGDSLKSITKRLDYKGYEKVSLTNFNGGSKLTHVIVAESELIKNKENLLLNDRARTEKIVVHHKSFNKLNNDPSQLEYMFWDDHQKLHTDLNKERWGNIEFSNKMKKIFSENGKKTWDNCDKNLKIKQLQDGLNNKLKNLTELERKEFFNNAGENNPMYGVSRFGETNPNYDNTTKHINDINESEYITYLINKKGNRRKLAMLKFNLNKSTVISYNKLLCKKYNLTRIEDLDFIFNNGFNIKTIKEFISTQTNPVRSVKIYCKKYNIDSFKLTSFLIKKGYKNWTDMVSTIGNHRVVSVEYLGKNKVYDLLNSSVDSNFAIKCESGMIISHNCTTLNDQGKMLNIYSDSKRVKTILEDLFFNRLDFHTSGPMWTRNTCKYGDNFIYLNIDATNGVIGSKQMPNYEMERRESGLFDMISGRELPDEEVSSGDKVKFFWRGRDVEFNSWQIAHFRLLGDDRRLPYGTSVLEKARRIWKQLLLSEDSMLVYRVTRAPERRVYKIFVGNIDDADVEPYVNAIADRFKRMPIVDPQTGQIDLRYNQLANDQDFFIPVRDENAPNPIDTLPGASNLDQIADIEYLRSNLFTALRVPKPFLGFDDATGDGKNLAIQDIRFSRTINRIQQSILQELNKIAIIHLYLLGFEDDLDNFTLTLNNPSTQAEMLKVEHLQLKVSLLKDAVSDIGTGFGVMSWTRAHREIMGWSDDEIKQDLLEQRMEKAASAELANTAAVIKHTGMFDSVDRIYGDFDVALNGGGSGEGEEGGDSGAGGSGGGFGGGGMGGEDLDFGDESDAEGEEGVPEEGAIDTEGGLDIDAEPETVAESLKKVEKLLTERKEVLVGDLNKRTNKYKNRFVDALVETIKPDKTKKVSNIKIYNKNLKINKDIDGMIGDIDKMLDE
jgi:hypothetical protein